MAFTVATSSTPQLANYLTWDVVWFFHLPTNWAVFPRGGTLTGNPTLDYGDSRLESFYNVDWETIADQAVAAGNVSAVCTHVLSQGGFRYYDSQTRLPKYNDIETYPLWGDDYAIYNSVVQAAGVTPDHLGRYVTAFRSRGIKVGFYIQEGQARNLQGNNGGNPNATARANYPTFIAKEARWLNNLYAPDFYWCDQPFITTFSAGERDAIYQGLKNPHGPLVINAAYAISGVPSITFPADVLHSEYPGGIPDSGHESFYNPTTTISGTDYYIPKGFAYTGLYANTNSFMWSYYVGGGPSNPSDTNVYNKVRSQSDFNLWYKHAKDRSVPFFCNMPPTPSGLIPTYYDRVISSNLTAV